MTLFRKEVALLWTVTPDQIPDARTISEATDIPQPLVLAWQTALRYTYLQSGDSRPAEVLQPQRSELELCCEPARGVELTRHPRHHQRQSRFRCLPNLPRPIEFILSLSRSAFKTTGSQDASSTSRDLRSHPWLLCRPGGNQSTTLVYLDPSQQ